MRATPWIRWVGALALAAILVGLAGYGGSGRPTLASARGLPAPRAAAGTQAKGGPAKTRLVATIYPLAFFARQVGGDRVDVVSLVPTGVEPHDWEPKPSTLKVLDTARVFVYNGAGLEPWVPKVLRSLGNRGLIPVEASQGLELLEGEEGQDPHIWLDPVYSQHIVRRIADALAQADPAGRATYDANARILVGELQKLDAAYQRLAACPRKAIVVSHAFFAYPAKRYGLQQIALMGLAPEAEPSPKAMAEIARYVREQGIRYVFYETLVSDKVARALARETGARTLVLNPIEGLTPKEEAEGKDYLDLMWDNLANLQVALECPR